MDVSADFYATNASVSGRSSFGENRTGEAWWDEISNWLEAEKTLAWIQYTYLSQLNDWTLPNCSRPHRARARLPALLKSPSNRRAGRLEVCPWSGHRNTLSVHVRPNPIKRTPA